MLRGAESGVWSTAVADSTMTVRAMDQRESLTGGDNGSWAQPIVRVDDQGGAGPLRRAGRPCGKTGLQRRHDGTSSGLGRESDEPEGRRPVAARVDSECRAQHGNQT